MITIRVLNKRKSTSELAFCGAPSPAFAVPCGRSLYADNIINFNISQCSETSEIKDKFTPKKVYSQLLSNSYFRLYNKYIYINADGEIVENILSNRFFNKAHNVLECGSYLSFAHEINELGEVAVNGKLHKANFCKDRLCPMCSWRRSYKIFSQVSQIMAEIHGDYKFLFLTLTIPNVKKEELNSSIDHLMSSWNRFSGYKPIKKILKGYFRALEITYNKETNTFHPHFHVVLAVPLSYGKGDLYIRRDDFLEMWRKATRDKSITQVDIRVCKNKYSKDELKAQNYLSSAVAEVAKYAVKSSDYLLEDEQLTDELVEVFSSALLHRRLVQFGGIFKEVFKKLRLDDAESDNADLVHINDKLNPSLSWLICRYGWSMGAYQLIGSYVETADKHLNN